MGGISVGDRFKMVKHPFQPICKIYALDCINSTVDVEWEDRSLMPPIDTYPLKYFMDGSFEKIREFSCFHNWVLYRGFREDYEFCSLCDEKKPK